MKESDKQRIGLHLPDRITLPRILIALLLFTSCAQHHEKLPAVFYPPPPEIPRLQFLTAISTEDDLKGQRSDFDNFLLGPEITFSQLGRPYAVTSTPGFLFVVDRHINKLVKIDLAAGNFALLGENWQGMLRSPAGITTDNTGNKYIADMTRKEIVVFDKEDNFTRTYGSRDILERPADVSVFQDRVYVCDIKQNKIFVFSRQTGQLTETIGETGRSEGQFYKPSHIFLDSKGNLFVNDAFNYRVQKFSREGKFTQTFGFHGDLIGAMARSKGMAVDHDGNLYVADAAFEYVQIFDPVGRLLLFFGGPGTKRGNLYLPAGIHIDYDNIEYFKNFVDDRFEIQYLLYVCNMSGQNKINVYGYGNWLDHRE